MLTLRETVTPKSSLRLQRWQWNTYLFFSIYVFTRTGLPRNFLKIFGKFFFFELILYPVSLFRFFECLFPLIPAALLPKIEFRIFKALTLDVGFFKSLCFVLICTGTLWDTQDFCNISIDGWLWWLTISLGLNSVCCLHCWNYCLIQMRQRSQTNLFIEPTFKQSETSCTKASMYTIIINQWITEEPFTTSYIYKRQFIPVA